MPRKLENLLNSIKGPATPKTVKSGRALPKKKKKSTLESEVDKEAAKMSMDRMPRRLRGE
jgi:hypothetical protein